MYPCYSMPSCSECSGLGIACRQCHRDILELEKDDSIGHKCRVFRIFNDLHSKVRVAKSIKENVEADIPIKMSTFHAMS